MLVRLVPIGLFYIGACIAERQVVPHSFLARTQTPHHIIIDLDGGDARGTPTFDVGPLQGHQWKYIAIDQSGASGLKNQGKQASD